MQGFFCRRVRQNYPSGFAVRVRQMPDFCRSRTYLNNAGSQGVLSGCFLFGAKYARPAEQKLPTRGILLVCGFIPKPLKSTSKGCRLSAVGIKGVSAADISVIPQSNIKGVFYEEVLRVIKVDNLRKEFKKTIKDPGVLGSLKALVHPHNEKVVAVDDISFSVPEGEILGFIGPNGAGKSTVIKMLTGILTPTSGKCTINGKNPTEDRKNYVREIGVVFGQRTQLWWDLPLRETYSVLKEIYEVPEDKYKKRMAFLNEVLDLESFITSPVRTLSLGQRMRADIAASLLHSPKVLFLDEPTIGLDVVVKDNIRNAIEYINKQEKTTVILTTHDLADIELLSKRIVMIDKGKNVFDGTISELKSRYGQMRELHFDTDAENVSEILAYKEHFNFVDEDISVETEGTAVSVRFNSAVVPVSDMLSYTLGKVKINDISVKDADIEEIIRRLYKQEG